MRNTLRSYLHALSSKVSKAFSKSGVMRIDWPDSDPARLTLCELEWLLNWSMPFCKLEWFLNQIDDAMVFLLQESSGHACPAATRLTRIVGMIPWNMYCSYHKEQRQNTKLDSTYSHRNGDLFDVACGSLITSFQYHQNNQHSRVEGCGFHKHLYHSLIYMHPPSSTPHPHNMIHNENRAPKQCGQYKRGV